MESWHTTSGLAWLHRDLADPDAERPDYPHHLAGIAFGRGYAHQAVPLLGMAATVAGVVRRELARPLEAADGRVLEVRVQVDVDLEDTLVLLSGPREALRLGLERLERVVSDPGSIDLSALNDRVPHPWAGRGEDLAAWFGAGPASLSTEIDPQRTDDTDALRDAITALDPARGVPVTGVTTCAELVGAVFAAGSATRGGPDHSVLRWRDLGSGSMRRGAETGLLSMRADPTAAGWVAHRVLLRAVADSLRVRGDTAGVAGFRVASTTVGEARLVVLHVAPTERGYDQGVVHGAVVQGVEACRDLAPARLEQLLAEMRTEEAIASRTHPVGMMLDGLRSGVREVSDDVHRDLAAVGVDDVRRHLHDLLGRVLLRLPAQADPPRGFPLLAAETVSVPAAGTHPSADFATRAPIALAGSTMLVTRVARRGDRLLSFGRARDGRGRAQGRETLLDSVDLSHLVARLDQGEMGETGLTTLVDRDDHRVRIPWWALKSRGSLRSQVEGLDRPPPTLSLPDPGWTDTVQRVRRWGLALKVGVGGMAALLVAVIVAGLVLGEDDDPATVAAVAYDQQVDLDNGTTLEVATPVAETRPGGGSLLSAGVWICGGGLTRSDGRDTEGRNYIDLGRFELDGALGEATADVPGGKAELSDGVTLAEGECIGGRIGFDVPAGQSEAGVGIRYANALGDQVTWR